MKGLKKGRAKARVRTFVAQEMRLRSKSLKDQQVTPLVRSRYIHFVKQMIRWLMTMGLSPHDRESLDAAVCEYIEACWSEGGALYAARHTVAGLLWVAPFVRPHLHEAWRLLGIWEKLVPPRRAAPISATMLCGVAGAALSIGLLPVAALLLAGFEGVLRSAEIFSLTRGDVYFARGRAVLRLRSTKMGVRRGELEMVVLKSRLAVSAMRAACARLEPQERICSFHPAKLRSVFKDLCKVLQLSYLNLTWYSLRRGGATAHFLGHGNLELTLQYGRWSSNKNTRRYVMQGAAEAVKLSLQPRQLALLHEAAKPLGVFCRRWGNPFISRCI